MLKKPILKESKSQFHSFIKDKTEKEHLKKVENLKKVLLNPAKENKFKDLRTLKNKVHSVLESKPLKKKKFDLNSDEENEDTNILRHKGQELDNVDDFNEEIEASSLDDDDLNREYVNDLHFGGFENNGNDPKNRKSKQEIYKEIIKKSKKMRYEKQKLREENIEKVEEIDQDEETMKKILELKMSKNQRRAQQPHEEDDYDILTKELFLDGKTYANNVSLKDPKKKEKDEKRKSKKQERIFSDDEENVEDEESEYKDDDDVKNDDELEENFAAEKRGIGYDFDKKQKKTAKLNEFINQLQEIKRKKLGENQSESESEEDLEPSSENEEDSENEEFYSDEAF